MGPTVARLRTGEPFLWSSPAFSWSLPSPVSETPPRFSSECKGLAGFVLDTRGSCFKDFQSENPKLLGAENFILLNPPRELGILHILISSLQGPMKKLLLFYFFFNSVIV